MLPQIKKRTHMQDYADHFLGRDFFSSFFSDGADYAVPAVNIKENDLGFEVELAAPGMAKEDIKILFEKDTLTISSDRKAEKEEEKDHYMKKEFSFKSFKRSFSIPETVNSDGIEAKYSNGVLTISLPRLNKGKDNNNKSIKIS